jgi:hypothetical protein
MAKLLQTRLPISQSDQITSDTYNRLVRTLELNLGTFDTDSIRQVSDSVRDSSHFELGSLIWNTSINSLQVYAGNNWITITEPTINRGLQAVGSVGTLSVKLAGSISVEV